MKGVSGVTSVTNMVAARVRVSPKQGRGKSVKGDDREKGLSRLTEKVNTRSVGATTVTVHCTSTQPQGEYRKSSTNIFTSTEAVIHSVGLRSTAVCRSVCFLQLFYYLPALHKINKLFN